MYGDIIFVERKKLLWRSYKKRRATIHNDFVDAIVSRLFSFTHFGIEVEDEQVIHYVIPSIRRSKECAIELISMEGFLKDGVKEVADNMHYAFPRDEIVRRAYSKIGDSNGRYNILTNNCEHYAIWCATDIKISNQSKFIAICRAIRKAPKRTVYFGRKAGSATVSFLRMCTSFYK
ncbi:MAG: lecithin retinol acyltransferase family protein [Vallitaleaceae bacterium]|jgi:hypothetical protein|nr:lecithin retinol acyltransferase family protein [Vallitaleaceae bacterium]